MGINAALTVFAAAVANVNGGTSNARMLCIGDSVTAGYGANGTSFLDNDRANSWPTYFAGLFESVAHSSWQSSIGSGGDIDLPQYDERYVFGSGWSLSAAFGESGTQTVGGYFPYAVSGAVAATWTPTENCDTYEFIYLENGSVGGEWSVEVGTSGATPVDTSPNTQLLKTETLDAGSAGLHALSIAYAGGDLVFFASVIAYNSAVKEVSVLNAGWVGSSTASWTIDDTTYSPLNTIDEYAPDLCVIMLGINDYNTGSPPNEATFKAQYQAIIDACVTAGADVMLVVPNPISAEPGATNQATYAGYIEDLATSNSLLVYNFQSSWGSWASANSNGWMRDTVHPNAAGYEQMATELFGAIYTASSFRAAWARGANVMIGGGP